MRVPAAAIAFLSIFGTSHVSAQTPPECNAKKSEAVHRMVQTQIDGLKCDRLQGTVKGISIGIDKADHRVSNVCYSEGSPNDDVRVNFELRCRTSGAALIPATFSEDVSVRMKVDHQTCKVDEGDIDAAGEIGRVLIESAEFFGTFKKPMQEAASTGCEAQLQAQ